MMGTPVVTAFGTACYDLIDVCHVISRLWVVPRGDRRADTLRLLLTSLSERRMYVDVPRPRG